MTKVDLDEIERGHGRRWAADARAEILALCAEVRALREVSEAARMHRYLSDSSSVSGDALDAALAKLYTAPGWSEDRTHELLTRDYAAETDRRIAAAERAVIEAASRWWHREAGDVESESALVARVADLEAARMGGGR